MQNCCAFLMFKRAKRVYYSIMRKGGQIDRFYSTGAWRNCRALFVASKKGLCERCAAKGLIVAGEHVHHKIRLTLQNINDKKVTLNFDNLELLCEECHKVEHGKEQARTDANGHVEL